MRCTCLVNTETLCFLIVFSEVLLFTTTLFAYNNEFKGMVDNLRQTREEQARRTHFAIVNNYLAGRENFKTSILGARLFKFNTFVVPQNKTFSIYFKNYKTPGHNVLQGCSVNNCNFTGMDRMLASADAVLVHLHRGIFPKVKNRDPKQRWIFMNDESPFYAFALAGRRVDLKELVNVFNWSMTYRTDADIPKIYGRTVPLEEPIFKTTDTSVLTEIIPNRNRKRRDILATVLMSNCIRFRLTLVNKLRKHVPVDMIGGCSGNKSLKFLCPGHFRRECDPISDYLFYLALENSDCKEYITEKLWYNAYVKGAIPVIMGPSLKDCKRLLPPHSFLHVSTFNNDKEIEKVAKYMIFLSENEDSLLSYHQWRNHFAAINEHGYFSSKSTYLCRLCEGLNYNDEGRKIYDEKEIRRFLDPAMSCRKNNV